MDLAVDVDLGVAFDALAEAGLPDFDVRRRAAVFTGAFDPPALDTAAFDEVDLRFAADFFFAGADFCVPPE